ncbi:MAG TPA: family 20 glycosylhydrolase [Woeseiaceae bacterium]|nr:family 20 glycosylhydrolase [Woeseiaceae bacterium]
MVARAIILAFLCALLPACASQGRPGFADDLQIIPRPASVSPSSGAFVLRPSTRIAVPDDDEVRWIGAWLADLLSRTAQPGIQLVDLGAPDSDIIVLQIASLPGNAGDEAYRLQVSPGKIVVAANDPAGLFYGAVSLWQLATAGAPVDRAITIPAVTIEDAPRFAWRGLMLDVARHYLPPPAIKNMIDWMALHKLNVLHWHLTDDQGWRLEIPGYPRLTEVGAWRVPAGEAAAQDIDPATGQPREYGGYYTADEVRDLVAYAAKRQVTIVPEIDMPGHAQAALAAYPQLGAGEPPAGVSSDWGVHDYLFNVEESTFATLEAILAEVLKLFPSPYIHIGGDEAVKTRWESSERVQARINELGLETEAELQSWFIKRIERFLAAHGRKLIGWDEILEGGLAPAATVMSWRGVDGAVEAASLGHDAVLTPSPTLYFDHFQSRLPGEPPGRGGVVSLQDVYSFDPIPEELSEAERRHVLGIQANLWSEHIRLPARLAYMAFPRAAALAEVAWSPPARLDWANFASRLPAQFERYRLLGIPFATSAFDVRVAADWRAAGDIVVELSNQSGTGTIRYTADGSAVTAGSPPYTEPLRLAASAELAAATFLGGRQVSRRAGGRVGRLASQRWSQELELCTRRLVLSLEDDAPVEATDARRVFLVDLMNPCWIWRGVDLSGVARIEASVGQVPFNFQLGADRDKIKLAPGSATGELIVRANGCQGELVAILPLLDPALTDGVRVLSGELDNPPQGETDLCFRFTARKLDPLWVLDRVALVRERHARDTAAP